MHTLSDQNFMGKLIEMKYLTPSWATLRVLGESKVIKLTCLTPFFGYVIILSDQFTILLMQVNTYLGLSNPKEDAIINAYFMYFGLLTLGVASGLYTLLAPALIKEYLSVRDYLSENIDYSTLSKLVGLAGHVKTKFTLKGENQHQIFDKIDLFEKKENDLRSPSFDLELRSLSIDLFSHFWNQTAYSNTKRRACVTTCFVVGFVLLLIPSAKLLYNVIF